MISSFGFPIQFQGPRQPYPATRVTRALGTRLLPDSERKNLISMRGFWPRTSRVSLKKWREFHQSCKLKKLRSFFAFPIFTVSSNIFSSLMESWCIVFVGNQSFSHRISIKKVSKPLIFTRYEKFSCFGTFVFPKKISAYSIHMSKH